MATFERFVSLATTYGHPEPERLAHATVQYKASLQKCKDKRHHTVLLTGPHPPIPQAPGKEVKAKLLCAARTLEGRPCGFAATCGCFCKKHTPTPVLKPTKPFRMLADPSRLEGVGLQGTCPAAAAKVCEVFGKPNGPKTEGTIAAWQFELAGGVAAQVAFRKGSRELHISCQDAKAAEAVRKLLL